MSTSMHPNSLPTLTDSTAAPTRDATRDMPACCGSGTPREPGATRATESPWVWMRLLLAIYLTGIAMTVTLVINITGDSGFAGSLDELGPETRGWLQALLIGITCSVCLLLGMNLVSGAWRAARRRQAAMETLIMLAMLGALGYSIASVVHGSGAVYFEVICVLLIVYALGQRLKTRVRESVTAKLDADNDSALSAHLIRPDGTVADVAVASIRPGQTVVVYPGQMIPVDGVVHSGTALVREAALTGESFAVARGPGQSVAAATICIDAELTVRATRSGDDRLIDQIHRAVASARETPTAIETSAQRIAAWFLPLVVSVALSTLLIWGWLGHWNHAFLNASAVLLVACPCALGLATPIAVWTALSQSAKLGLIAKHGDAVLSLASVDCVCFDKTGTLTASESYTPHYHTLPGVKWSLDAIQTIVAAVERTSDHPFAVALRRGISFQEEGQQLQVRDVHLLAGRGIAATVEQRDNGTVLEVQIVTSVTPIAATRPATAAVADDRVARLDVLFDSQLVAHIELAETISAELFEMFAALRRQRIKTVVLSGDAQSRVDAIPADIQRGAMSSTQKSEFVKQLKRNHHVLYVGDGFNDAQALAAADVGLAAAWGTDFAGETADIVWTRRDFKALVEALAMSRRVHATIRSNLAFAASYNTIGMSLAALGWLHPIAAALLMLASSLTVTLRASRGQNSPRSKREPWPSPTLNPAK